MNSGRIKALAIITGCAAALTVCVYAQQDTGPIQGDAGQASQPAGVTSRRGNPASTNNATSSGGSESVPATPRGTSSSTVAAPASAPQTDKNATTSDNAGSGMDAATPKTDSSTPKLDTSSQKTDISTPQTDEPRTVVNGASSDPNANNPILEPPPLPKTKPTLIGGTAARVDHVRNLLTIEPFGSKQKVKLFIDERTHIYRNGQETTVLGIRKGDRVYADTMLDGSRVFAKNVRIENQVGAAEVRGQITAVNRENGTVTVKDELSAQPVTFTVGGGTAYSAFKGNASSADLKPGSLIDVQFAPGKDKHDQAQEVIVLARPGESYVFSGVVTNIDMRSGTLALENRSDEQTYELHFSDAALDDRNKLKVGSEVTAHAIFDGKQYNAKDLQLQVAAPNEAKQQ
jgi:hypothetical protein